MRPQPAALAGVFPFCECIIIGACMRAMCVSVCFQRGGRRLCAAALVCDVEPGFDVCQRRRVQPEEWTAFLRDVGLFASIIFNVEWLYEFLTYGYNEFFADNWYVGDTVVNILNWGSYIRDSGIVGRPMADFLPNIAFLRMLRFLKPLGRIPLLFPSKVVVKTVAASMKSMAPVLALVGFALFFFGIMGIYIFGSKGEMYYRCGVALEPHDAIQFYDPGEYSFDPNRDMQVVNCTVDMDRYHEFLKLRGSPVLGTTLPVPAGNSSVAAETSANFSSNKSGANVSITTQPYAQEANGSNMSNARRLRRLMSAEHSNSPPHIDVAIQYLDADTGKLATRQTTFGIITPESQTDTCKAEEIFVVNGTEMSMAEFVQSEEFKGRYKWLGSPFEGGGGEHRRRREAAHGEKESIVASEGSEHRVDHSEFTNFRDVRCIMQVPAKICSCAAAELGTEAVLVTDNVCIDPNCPSSLCFVGLSPPISNIHGFSNIGNAAMTTIAIFFQQSWSIWMEKSAEVDPLMSFIYYFMTVILGSFCLLNLTVATVGQNYSRVKEEATRKKDLKIAEQARKDKIQAERDEMKKMAQKDKEGDGNEDDGDDEIIQLFDTTTAYKYWIFGLVGLTFLHRYYFKLYNVDAPLGMSAKSIQAWPAPFRFSIFWFIFRCLTLNYFLVGWILDAVRMNSLNDEASVAEKERIEAWTEDTYNNFCDEIERLLHENVLAKAGSGDQKEKMRLIIGKVLLYPHLNRDDFPWSNSREFIEEDFAKFKAENKDALESLGLSIGVADDLEVMEGDDDLPSQGGSDDFSDVDDENDEDQGQGGDKAKTQSHFAWFADFVVVANAMTLAMEGFDDSIQIYLDMVGYFASIFFILEALVKIFACGGFSYYLKDPDNAYDFTLVLLPSLGEATTITTEALGLGPDYVYPMLALQSLRVFRITKLTKHLVGLKRLTQQAMGSPEGVVYAMAVTIIFIIFMSLFGNELFRNSIAFAMRRNDYQYILSALKAMVEFLFGQSYYKNLEIGLLDANFIGLIFFVGYYYVANYLVLRMFIALILENFEFDEDKRVALQIQLFQKRQVVSNDLIDGQAKSFPIDEQWQRLRKPNLDPDHLSDFQTRWTKIVMDQAAESGVSNKPKNLWDVIIEADEKGLDAFGAAAELPGLIKLLTKVKVIFRNWVYDLIEWQLFNLFVAACIIFSVVLLQVDTKEKPILDPAIRLTIDRSLLGFFTAEMFAKMFAFGVFSKPLPIRRTVAFPQGMPTFFSATEEGGWNMIDFVFICISYVDASGVDIGNFKVLRIVRVVRPLQKNIETVQGLIAAILSSIVSIFHVFNLLLLMMIIWGLIGVSLFRGRFHSCNDLHASHFTECIGNAYGGLPSLECDFMDPLHPNGTVCENPVGLFLEQQILVPRVWDKPHENFENMAGGVMFLFRLLNSDNLRPLFHSLMDVPETTQLLCSGGGQGDAGCPPGESQYVVSSQPQEGSKPENILFALVYMFLANAFVSQLVIGVLIDNIRQQTGTALFTTAQRTWDSTGKTINQMLKLPAKATKPTDVEIWGPIKLYGREFLYEILNSELYDTIMMCIIIINTIWMATEHWPAEHWYHVLKYFVDITFVYVYLVETIAKMYSFGVIGWQEDSETTIRPGDNAILKKLKIKNLRSPYFGDPWCMFDFFVVMLSCLMTWFELPPALAPLKLLRVLRVFRLVKKVPVLQIMISTLVGAMPSIVSALFFLSIWIFLFSAIGMQFFANVKHGEVIGNQWHFRDNVSAMMMLFRISTGDGWFPIIYDASISYPHCTPDVQVPNTCDASCDPLCDPTAPTITVQGDCGAGPIAYAYFMIFWFGTNFLWMPLFVATLIDYFFEAQINENSIFNDVECEKYADAWMEFDEHRTESISIENLRPLIERLCDMGSRVGFRVASDRDRYKKIWAMIMTNPEKFPPDGLTLPEEDQEAFGFEVLDRDKILKAFPNNERSKKIRKFVYEHTKVREKEEVAFKYCAKVLCIFQNTDAIKAPITTSDLLNRGAALQRFMGMIGMMDGVKGTFAGGQENGGKTRWEALAVHNSMVKSLDDKANKARTLLQKVPDVSQLSRIMMAVDVVRLQVKPPPPLAGTGDEPQPKPTGDKREALIKKISKLNESFDDIANSAIQILLYGIDTHDDQRIDGILDVLLQRIIDHEVNWYANGACKSIQKRFALGAKSKQFSQQRRYSMNILEKKQYEPIVTTVPRGWLNSQRKPKLKRLAFSPEVQDIVEDKTDKTINFLSQLAPARPKRLDSARMPEMTHRSGGPNDARSSHLKARVNDIGKNQAWRQMFVNQQFRENDKPPDSAPGASGGIEFSWREQYSTALDSVADRINQRRPNFPPLALSAPEIFSPMEQLAERINQRRPNFPPLALSAPEIFSSMEQLMVLGSMVGLCEAPQKIEGAETEPEGPPTE